MWFIYAVAVLHSTMRDSEVVAAIVAGDPEGLAEAYDRYASPLYTYCRSLLREPADAADAVQDTFVIAASRLAGLRDANRLRPWLYAVARNECHRRLRARAAQVSTPLDEMPDVTDTSADVSGEAEREDLRRLLRSAVRGLNPGEQDLIELQLQQGLDVKQRSLDHVLANMRQFSGKPIDVQRTPIPDGPTTWSTEQLARYADTYTRFKQGGDTAVMHVLVVHGNLPGADQGNGMLVPGPCLFGGLGFGHRASLPARNRPRGLTAALQAVDY